MAHQQATLESPEHVDIAANLCRRDFTDADAISACENKYHEEYLHVLSEDRQIIIAFALIPVPLGWGFVFLVIFLIGWIKRGFQRTPSTEAPVVCTEPVPAHPYTEAQAPAEAPAPEAPDFQAVHPKPYCIGRRDTTGILDQIAAKRGQDCDEPVEEPFELVGIGGWLLLLIIGLSFSGIQFILRGGIDIVFGLGNLWIAYALYRGINRALTQAKVWLMIRLLFTALPALVLFLIANQEPSSAYEQAYKEAQMASPYLFQGIAYAFWLLYLYKSRRVRNTYVN
jgi:hypothetical protein